MPTDDPVELEEAVDAVETAAAESRATRRALILASVVSAAGILGSRILGLVRMQVVSAQFGAADAGALRAAFDLPDLIFYLVAGGAIRSGFVPVFTDLLTKGSDDEEKRRHAWWLFSVLVTLVAFLGALLVVVGEVFAPALIAPMTGQWAGDWMAGSGLLKHLPAWMPQAPPTPVHTSGYSPQAIELTVRLTRLMLPAQIFLVVGGLLSAALNSLKHFNVPALVPCIYNLAIIVPMVAFGASMGVSSAAWGVLVGAFLGHFVLQIIALQRVGKPHGATYRPQLVLWDKTVLRVLKVAAPIMLGLCVAEINNKISGWVMGGFGESARAWYDNASRVARLPDGIFGGGLGVALFPFLSQLASEGRFDEFRRQGEYILRLAIVCTLPCCVLMACAPLPVTELLFGHGQYTPADVAATARLLPLFAIGTLPITIQVVIVRAFYANEDSITPVKVGLVAVLAGAVLNVLLAIWLGQAGPPLALSITSLLMTAGLMWLYGRRFGYARSDRLWRVLWLSLVASLLSAVAAREAVMLLARYGSAVQCLALLVVGFTVYALLMKWAKVEEIGDVVGIVKRRFRRRRRRRAG